jgi:hypothetical protein
MSSLTVSIQKLPSMTTLHDKYPVLHCKFNIYKTQEDLKLGNKHAIVRATLQNNPHEMQAEILKICTSLPILTIRPDHEVKRQSLVMFYIDDENDVITLTEHFESWCALVEFHEQYLQNCINNQGPKYHSQFKPMKIFIILNQSDLSLTNTVVLCSKPLDVDLIETSKENNDSVSRPFALSSFTPSFCP